MYLGWDGQHPVGHNIQGGVAGTLLVCPDFGREGADDGHHIALLQIQ